MEEKMLKVNCSFCDKEIECPEDMINAEKHACFECFQKRKNELPIEDSTKVHVDIPRDKMDEMVPDILINSLLNETFPLMWKERKIELKQMSKREIAEAMFGAGAESMINLMKEMDELANEEENRIAKEKND